MKTLLKLILVALTLQFVACSTPEITISRSTGEQVEIFPDYKDIIIPCNIAPMNFTVTGEGNYHLIISGSGEQLQVRAETIMNAASIAQKSGCPMKASDIFALLNIDGEYDRLVDMLRENEQAQATD